jgi:thiol-disulfide isomerase/thioredoxin|tara:strand:+ start:275 stop:886 length:612 start_codon:yes stop_codon:yes gene_type:complete
MKKEANNFITNALRNSVSYNEFILLVKELVAKNSTTGVEKTESLINYTKLNERRIKRWNKTLKISDESKKVIENFSKETTWLVLTESWCGDAAHVMPVMNKIAKLNDNIDLKVVLRDQNKELMNQFLTNGNKSIPKLIMIDNQSDEVVNSYGPRPTDATKLVNEYNSKHGKLTPEFKEGLQKWYNKDKGQNTINDLIDLLKTS